MSLSCCEKRAVGKKTFNPQSINREHKSFIIPIGRVTGIEENLLRFKNVAAEIQIGDNYKIELIEIIKKKTI